MKLLVAVLLAAGAATRVGEDKMLADLGGLPLVRWSADRLAAEPRIERIVLVDRPHGIPVADAMRGLAKRFDVCVGGPERADSVRAALAAVQAETVLVHDAARPFLDAATLARVIEALEGHGAAAAALPVADTLHRGTEWAGETIDRAGLWAMQTPQAFPREPLLRAYESSGDPTDCAEAYVRAGGRVRLVRGDPLNFKVTTREDLALARSLVGRGVVVRPS